MLKGIEKNFKENYTHMINLKRKDQLKSKEDVSVTEAFELYMLKKFHGINLNSLTSKMLNFWEKDFDQSINKHIKFLKENLENQNNYSSKFSEILQEMDIFHSEDEEKITRKIRMRILIINQMKIKNLMITRKSKIKIKKLRQV